MLIESNIQYTDTENLINYISEKTSIHKERLNVIKQTNINDNYTLTLDTKKIYLFFFETITLKNFKIFIDNELYNLCSSCLILYDNDCKIEITFNDTKKMQMKLFVFVDILNGYDLKQNELINKYKPTNGILIFENNELITDELCYELINYINALEKPGFEKWGLNTNVICKFININEINNQKIKNNFDCQIFKIIEWIINKLKQEYNITCSGDSGYYLRKIYGPTKLHIDGIKINPIDNRYLPIKKIRNASVIICLNDDYEGGQFYFPLQNYKIKLKKGQIIVFPPYWTHPHMVYEPIKNTYRYTINTWLYE